MKAKIFFLFVLLTLSACATLPSSVEDLTPPDQLGNIAVLSVLGDKLNITYVGATIFGNRYNAADVSEWNIDNYVVKKTEDYLKESGYAVKQISYEKALLLKAYNNPEPIYGTYSEYVEDYLVKLAEEGGIDTFVVIYSTKQEDYVGHGEECLQGYGLYQRFSMSMLSAPTTALYSNLRFEVIKPKPFKKITVKKSSDFELIAPEHFKESYKHQVKEGTLFVIENKDVAVLAKKLSKSLNGAISKGLAYAGLKIWDQKHDKQVQTAAEVTQGERERGQRPGFNVKRLVKAYTMNLTSPPEEVFPLLCPTRKYEWIDYWECDMIYSDSGVAENNCVFQTDLPRCGKMIWVVTRYDYPHAIEFTVFNLDSHILKLDITLKLDGNGGTCANWGHTFTAITVRGKEFIAKYTDDAHQKKMSRLEQSLEHFCRTGEMLHMTQKR